MRCHISIIIATLDRAEILAETLENMTRLDRHGLEVEFIVVDNNSSDHTKQVITSFKSQLPIRYLFEPHAGQNRARNRALNEAPLGRLVVFTDDDVTPQPDWLHQVAWAANAFPEYSVFGGGIDVIWPTGHVPAWAHHRSIRSFCFGAHDRETLGIGRADAPTSPHPYRVGSYPFSANFWAKKEVFTKGRRFDDSIGPHPTSWIVGSETAFLSALSSEGYGMLYCPSSVVGHRVQRSQLDRWYIARRAYRYGRGRPYIDGMCQGDLFCEHPMWWHVRRVASLVKWGLRVGRAMVDLSSDRRVERSIEPIIAIGNQVESLRVAGKMRREQTGGG